MNGNNRMDDNLGKLIEDDNLRKLIEDELENSRKQSKTRVNRAIAEELTPQGDLLPPWRKFPKIQAGSFGWGMEYCEFYAAAWGKWAKEGKKEELKASFKNN